MSTRFEWLKRQQWIVHVLQIVLVVGLVAVGVYAFRWAQANKPEPQTEQRVPPPRLVDAVQIERADYPVTLSGFGTVESPELVQVSPQVGGRVIYVHPRLEMGEILRQGDVVLRLDPRDYELQIALNDGEAKRLQAEITRLRQEMANIESTIDIRQGQLALSKREQARLEKLSQTTKGIITATELEAAEKQVLGDQEAIRSMRNQLQVIPLQIDGLEVQIANLATANEQQRLNIARCELTAPMTGRITETSLENGQMVAPNQVVATVVDDRALEIMLPLDAGEVRRYLAFQDVPTDEALGWFPPPQPVQATVRWVDDRDDTAWPAQVDRVASYDPQTRMVKLVVRLLPDAPGLAPQDRPVMGMFCRVEIPGKSMHDVIQIPRAALQSGDRVYAIRDQRLAVIPVQPLREADRDLIVDGELETGDWLVTSKMNTALEGMRLMRRGAEAAEDAAAADPSTLPQSDATPDTDDTDDASGPEAAGATREAEGGPRT